MSQVFPHQPADSQRYAIVGGTAILPDRLIEDSYIEWSQGVLRRVGPAPKRISKDVQLIDANGLYVSQDGSTSMFTAGEARISWMELLKRFS